MVEALDGLFETLDPEKYIPVMTLMGNALFGRVSSIAGAREKMIEDIIMQVLSEHNLRRLAAESLYELETTSGGDNLPVVFRERIGFSRASIKKPDSLILYNSLASHNQQTREQASEYQ